MLIIRSVQCAALASTARMEYLSAMLGILKEKYPYTLSSLPDAELLARIGSGLDAAARHGFVTADDTGRFVELTALMGVGFEQADWAAPLLAAAGPARAAELHAEGLLMVDLDD